MKTKILAASAVLLFISAGVAEEEQPSFPKVGVEYRITLPLATGKTVDLDHSATNVVIMKWIGGSWFEVAYLGPKKVERTNLNVSRLLTMREAEKKRVIEAMKKASAGPPEN